MVEIHVSNKYQVTLFEWFCVKKNIPHKVVVDKGLLGLDTPFLVVDGIPLNTERSITWMNEKEGE